MSRKKQGKYKIKREYHPGGTLECERPYVNGQRHGVAKWYYPDGTLACEHPFVNGQRHGVWKMYEYKKEVTNEAQRKKRNQTTDSSD